MQKPDYPVMQCFVLVKQFKPGCSFCSLENSITFSDKVDDILGYIFRPSLQLLLLTAQKGRKLFHML